METSELESLRAENERLASQSETWRKGFEALQESFIVQAAELDKLRTALQKALKLSQDTTHPDADYLLEEIEEVIKSALKP